MHYCARAVPHRRNVEITYTGRRRIGALKGRYIRPNIPVYIVRRARRPDTRTRDANRTLI